MEQKYKIENLKSRLDKSLQAIDVIENVITQLVKDVENQKQNEKQMIEKEQKIKELLSQVSEYMS